MDLPTQLAKHFRELHFGGNWTSVNLKETISDITLHEAELKIDELNSIKALLFHVNYYISEVLKVLEGDELKAKDKYSYDAPRFKSQEDWMKFQNKCWSNVNKFADLVELLPEDKIWKEFTNEKYGSYYSNIQGIIEHSHYHLGQIVLIKKLIRGSNQY